VNRRRRCRRGEQEQQEQDRQEAAHGPVTVPATSCGGSGGRAAKRPLRKNPRALAADRALELVRDAGPLHNEVRAYGVVLVGKPQDAKGHMHCYSM
jgi:hypothetical protein